MYSITSKLSQRTMDTINGDLHTASEMCINFHHLIDPQGFVNTTPFKTNTTTLSGWFKAQLPIQFTDLIDFLLVLHLPSTLVHMTSPSSRPMRELIRVWPNVVSSLVSAGNSALAHKPYLPILHALLPNDRDVLVNICIRTEKAATTGDDHEEAECIRLFDIHYAKMAESNRHKKPPPIHQLTAALAADIRHKDRLDKLQRTLATLVPVREGLLKPPSNTPLAHPRPQPTPRPSPGLDLAQALQSAAKLLAAQAAKTNSPDPATHPLRTYSRNTGGLDFNEVLAPRGAVAQNEITAEDVETEMPSLAPPPPSTLQPTHQRQCPPP
jgi:hypothetical protein